MRHKDRQGFDEFADRRRGRRGDEPRAKADVLGERGPAHSRHARGGHGGPRGRGRAQRGDVRTAILLLLAEKPMHGYQIINTMSDRTGGAWRPSPGAVYPTIGQLQDEGLVTTQDEDGRRLVTLTSEGRSYLDERRARLGDPFTAIAAAPGPDLRDPLHGLQIAVRQIAGGGNADEAEAAAEVLATARRSLYLILAGEADQVAERTG